MLLKKVNGTLLAAKEVLILTARMKLIVYYIHFLSLLFAYPHHTVVTNANHGFFSIGSFQKTQQPDLIVSRDSPNLAGFFNDELLDNNDNDPISTRKKASFRAIAFSSPAPYASLNCLNNTNTKLYCHSDFYSPSFSDFISLRVLRL